jgi:NAD+ diphosphatase
LIRVARLGSVYSAIKLSERRVWYDPVPGLLDNHEIINMHWRQDMPRLASASRFPEVLSEPHYIGVMGGKLIAPPGGRWQPLSQMALLESGVPLDSQHYLGRLDGTDYIAIAVPGDARLESGFSAIGLRQLLGRVDEELFYLAGRAAQIVSWDRGSMFCGACGGPTRVQDHDRSKICDACKIPVYPTLSPSIIVLVTKGEQMLLARNAAWGPDGFYSTLAGFVEPGESVEETVHREVHEEVGVQVKNVRYLGSQSWPFPNSLMLGYQAEYAGGEFQYHDEEIADAQWFDIDDLPKVPGGIAISRWLIDAFIEEVTASRQG